MIITCVVERCFMGVEQGEHTGKVTGGGGAAQAASLLHLLLLFLRLCLGFFPAQARLTSMAS